MAVAVAVAWPRKERGRVYWLSTLCVILKCNHNPNGHIYDIHRRAPRRAYWSLLFINVYTVYDTKLLNQPRRPHSWKTASFKYAACGNVFVIEACVKDAAPTHAAQRRCCSALPRGRSRLLSF